MQKTEEGHATQIGTYDHQLQRLDEKLKTNQDTRKSVYNEFDAPLNYNTQIVDNTKNIMKHFK